MRLGTFTYAQKSTLKVVCVFVKGIWGRMSISVICCAGGGFMKVWGVSMDQCNCINARTVQSHYDRNADVLLFSVRK